MRYVKKLILFSLLLCANLAQAGFEDRNSRITGQYLLFPGAFIQSEDDKFTGPGWVTGFTNINNKTIVEFGINEELHQPHPTYFKLKVLYDVILWNVSATPITLTNQALEVDYNPIELTKYKDKAQIIYNNFYKAKVFNIRVSKCNISNVCVSNQTTDDAYLQVSVNTERLYNFTLGSAMPFAAVNNVYDGTKNELLVTWDYFKGAEEYELEYTHVDDYDLQGGLPTIRPDAQILYDFKHDATRIVTTANNYIIPVNYERGYLIYRIRPIGRGFNGERLEGAWTQLVPESGDLSAFFAALGTQPNIDRYSYKVLSTLQSDNINWTSVKTFAENGKFGSGVVYSDAVGLSRQSIARLNTDRKTIISSTVYDYYGRPTINMMPSPINSLNFSYKPNLNKINQNTILDKTAFDFCQVNKCDVVAMPLDSLSSLGAANYYSPSNPNKTFMQMYLPDSKGFPYTRVKYLSDGTGRVMMQSLPGLSHQLQGIHDIEYAYVKPTQVELDRLFGIEANAAIFCSKTYVVDPNGQTSATYYDKFGRTIATTIVGAAPPEMDQLPDQTGEVTLTDHMEDPPTNSIDTLNNCIEVSTSFYLPGIATQTISYQAELGKYIAACNNLCLDCVYDLELSLVDACGTNFWPLNMPSKITIPNLQEYVNSCQGPYDCSDCFVENGQYQLPPNGTVAINFTQKGTYYLNKKICVSNKPIDAYVELFKNTPGCTVNYCDVLAQAISDATFNCAAPTCESCLQQLNNLINGGGGHGPRTDYTPQQIAALQQQCDNLCAKSECEKLKRCMMAEFHPGGTFARLGPNDPITNLPDPLWASSIFNPANNLNTNFATPGGNTFNNPPLNNPPTFFAYKDFLNQNAIVPQVIIGNNPAKPHQLTQAQFIQYFNPTWAEALIPLHPDYCKYKFYCQVLGASLQYDANMQAVNHYDEACILGFIRPYPSGNFGAYAPSNLCAGNNADPFLNIITGSTLTAFTGSLTTNFDGSSNNIYLYSGIEANNNTPNPPAFGTNSCVADVQWAKFRENYLNIKQAFYSQLLAGYLGANPLCNNPGGPTNYPSCFPDPDETDNDLLQELNAQPPPNNNWQQNINQYIAAQCSTQCNTYRPVWEGDLLNYCPNFVLLSQANKNLILDGFEAICNLGCDANHQAGSSSINPNNNPGYLIPNSNNVYATNFQQVLNYYLPPSNSCNSLVIASPPPYSLSSDNQNDKLNDCKCNEIIRMEYLFNNPNQLVPPGLPQGVNSPWKLFKNQHGFDLVNFNTLLCSCKSALTNPNAWTPGYAWTQQELNNLAPIVAAIPGVDSRLACEDCIKCSDVVTQLNNLYPSLPNQNYPNLFAAIDNDDTNSIIAENFLNNYFGKEYDIDDYLDLYEDCQTFGSSPPNQFTWANNVTEHTVELFNYLVGMKNKNLLTVSHPMLLCTDEDYFLSNLYSGILPPAINQGYQYNVGPINNTNLTINIFNPITNSNVNTINLSIPIGVGGWNNIISLDSIRAYKNPPLPGSTNSFVIYGTTILNSIVQIMGNNSQFVIAKLSSSSPYQPIFCNEVPLVNPNSCMINSIKTIIANVTNNMEEAQSEDIANFIYKYKKKCLFGLQETFTRIYKLQEYSYTLYYYDQAGNLVRTVAPKGVTPLPISTNLSQIQNPPLYPNHSLQNNGVPLHYVNDYQFNSYNQPLNENTIDGGYTKYFYDQYGRVVASQNAKQAALSINGNYYYSYTLYEAVNFQESNGRIKEVGQMRSTQPLTDATAQNYYGINAPGFISYVSTCVRTEVTKTYYDRQTLNASVLARFTLGTQRNLRNRVAFVTYEDVYDANDATYNYGTYYSYDQHGNADQILQHYPAVEPTFGNQMKKIDYEFDLVSGNMKRAYYQRGFADVIIHEYFYDDDNRLHEVYTSKDMINWDRDAKYFYYEHGPLARIERADKQVQGSDYYYTIHGWIKGVNSDGLGINNDVGKDAAFTNAYHNSYGNIHGYFARDAMGFGLNYYKTGNDEDYNSIARYRFTANATNNLNPVSDKTNLYANASPFGLSQGGVGGNLFNGNISSMVTNFIDKDAIGNLQADNAPNPQIAAYRYDMLQRIKLMRTFRSLVGNTWQTSNGGNYDQSYNMDIGYEGNGNIKFLTRNGAGNTIVNGGNLPMDNLLYTYFEGVSNGGVVANNSYFSNKLACVQDGVPSNFYGDDIDTYATCTEQNSRYEYDEIGNMIEDKGEYIDSIEWTVDRKVKRIIRDVQAMLLTGTGINSVYKPDIEYEYNPMRQRIMKLVKPRDQVTKLIRPYQDWIYTYYVYDASGNVVAVYDRNATLINNNTQVQQKLKLAEHHIYGSQRLAINRTAKEVTWNVVTAVGNNTIIINPNDPPDNPNLLAAPGPGEDPPPVAISTLATGRYLGYKEFELPNHLGNVIATVSDRKVQVLDCAQMMLNFDQGPVPVNVIPDGVTLGVEYGWLKVSQPVAAQSGVKFSYPVVQNQVYKISFDVAIGIIKPNDGLTGSSFEYNFGNQTQGGTPITIPVNGSGHYDITYTATAGPSFSGLSKLYITTNNNVSPNGNYFFVDNFAVQAITQNNNPPQFPPAPCPNNAYVLNSYFPDMLMHTDYYAFGSQMPGRTWVASDYRYGMNGQEKDDEIVGSGNIYTAEFWEYDARTGRRWNRDPVDKPWMSPYHAFSNKPIWNIDPNGANDTDYLNKETGEATHVEDGVDQVVTVSNKDFQKVKELGSDAKKTWTKDESIEYMKIRDNAQKVDPNSDLGKISRVVYAEMSGLGTSNVDRQVVAESIVNRKASGLYGDTYSEILVPSQYNALTTDAYKDPYKYMKNMEEKSPYFYEANEKKIIGNYLDALSASYKAYNNIGPKIGQGVVSYVSPPLKSTHFNGDKNLINITLQIKGLKGISGVWKRK